MATQPTKFWQIVLGHAGRAKAGVALAVLAMMALVATDLLRPWPLKIIFDYVLLDRPAPESLAFAAGWFESKKTLAILVVSSAIVVIAALRGAFAYLESYHTARLGSQLAFVLRNTLFAHVQRLSLSYHMRRGTGELMTKIAGDAATVKSFFSDSALALGSHVLMIAGTFTVMFLMNWKLALIVLASFPLLVWNIYFLHRRARAAVQSQRKKEDRLASHISEVLSTVQLVQAFGREEHEQRRFESDNGEFLDQSVKNARIESAAARAVEITTAAGTCAVVLYGSLQVLDGSMTPGTILVFSSYLHGLYRPIRRMVKLAIRLSRLQVAIQRISEILETEPGIKDRPNAIRAGRVQGEIVFDKVCFAYSADQADVLTNLSFRIAPGQRVAIMGASGAGKSTLIGLLLRLYDPGSGNVALDGVDLRDYERESLRSQIGVVLQDSVLRGATVIENILYGNLSATRQDAIAAAKAAHAHGFVQELEEGYETVVGKRGARLSGGQQRRIAIARALVRNSPILILDEPTTGLDALSERHLEAGLETLMQDKTCLLITHDHRAASRADTVIMLEGGKVVESGPPEQLRTSGGSFAQLCRGRSSERRPRFEIKA